MGRRAEDSHDPVGREAGLATIEEFLARPDAGTLLLTGGPGIGKTTLWEAAVAAARSRELRTLAARPSGAEAQLLFSALTDLFDGIATAELGDVPAPQRHALEVALLRAEPGAHAPERRAIALGVLNALRSLSAHGPLLVAIDDVNWLDSASAEALAFAVRRLGDEPVSFLLAQRSGEPAALEPRRLEQLDVGPLSLGATRRILSDRLGLSVPRRVLRQLHEASQGNPLFSLELGRVLVERGVPEVGDALPVTDAVEDLLGARLARLPERVRRVLLALSLDADLDPSQLAGVAGQQAMEEAVAAGVVVREADRLRPSHPLLAAAARHHASAAERGALHLELARRVADRELRARHLALAAERPDGVLSATIAAAARRASARGGAEAAVELGEHALRLTPRGGEPESERLLALADYLLRAGDTARVSALLVPKLDSLPAGVARGRAHLLLVDVGATAAEVEDHFEQALAEIGNDPAMRATVLAKRALYATAGWVRHVRTAEKWALEARALAQRAGPELEGQVLYALAWARVLRGQPIDDLLDSAAAAAATAPIFDSLDLVAAIRLGWRGELHEARARLGRLLTLADERGEELSYVAVRLHLWELELRAGNWEAAALLLDEWDRDRDTQLLGAPIHERGRALLAAGRGDPVEAERWAAETLARAEAIGVRWDVLEALRARGIASLLAGDPARAVENLREVWRYTQQEGVKDPAAFPVAPDLVEALLEVGEAGEAEAVSARLQALSEQQHHARGLATAQRCHALLALRSRYDEDAEARLVAAAERSAALGLLFEHARALLALGRTLRRRRKWAAARSRLEQAAAALEEIGSVGWADQARAELASLAGRRPGQRGALTPAERRVAGLAAEGLTNKQIASTLFVTVNTVEVHLSHAYAKLGVRSRTQLARRLAAES